MKRWINGKLYDLSNSKIVFYSEDPNILNYPKGYRFVCVRLMLTENGDYFLHGMGPWGCHSIVPMDEIEKEKWLKKLGAPIQSPYNFAEVVESSGYVKV